MQKLSTHQQLHQQRIRSYLSGNSAKTFPVIDTCRVDNGGLVSLEGFPVASNLKIVAFTPSAGAASRYFQPLDSLHEAIKQGDSSKLAVINGKLRNEGALSWPLPESLVKFISLECPALDDEIRNELLHWLEAPKALLPHQSGGEDFLTAKFREHDDLPWIKGQVYVTQEHRQQLFAACWDNYQKQHHSPKQVLFLEQNADMCTIRFDSKGEPIRLDDGSFSSVPAGHGTLTKLFPEVSQRFPDADALFIKNIDNVIPRNQETLHIHGQFFAAYEQVLQLVRRIRDSLKTRHIEAAELSAAQLLNLWPQPRYCQGKKLTALESKLFEQHPCCLSVLQQLFHAGPAVFAFFAKQASSNLELLETLFNRPVNILGQVPNLGKDIGGTPVFAETAAGRQKICLELPHFSPEDRERFLLDAHKATHFNPVFVAAELVKDSGYYENVDSPFWIIAEKTFQGRTVYYHETVLYELLGNSLFTNCLFATLPRLVFRPHKTLLDRNCPP